MTTAIYALSGDPITFGHIDIIERASKVFDKLIVGLGINPKKKYLLTPEEREEVAKLSLKNLKNVEVKFFEGLLVDFAYEQGAKVIVRGIRNSSDAVDEQSLDQINSSQMNIETFFMFSRSKLSHVSSSSVKGLQEANGLIFEYVPLPVKKIIEKKISNQLIYGVTGIMGSGKSYVAEKLVEYAKEQNSLDKENPLIFNIEMDNLAHKVYSSDLPAYKDIREQIEKRFGTLDRKEIGKIAFSGEKSKENVDFLNSIFKNALMVLLRKELRGKQGIILVNAALLVEGGLLDVCNNHVVLVESSPETRYLRLLAGRNIDKETADSRVKHMLSNEEKEKQIRDICDQKNYGNIIKFNNDPATQDSIVEFYKKLKKEFNL